MEGRAFHAGHEFDDAGVADVEDEAVDDLVAEVAVGHLAAFEAQRRLDLVAFAEEADRHVLFGLVVVLVDGDGELDFLDDDDLLLLAGGAVGLVFFVEIFAVVLDLADGRDSVGGDFYKVEGALAGHFEGFEGRHDAELFAIFVDDADFTGADALIGADKGFCGTLIDRWNSLPPQRARGLPPCIVRVECSGAEGVRSDKPKRRRRNVEYSIAFKIAP